MIRFPSTSSASSSRLPSPLAPNQSAPIVSSRECATRTSSRLCRCKYLAPRTPYRPTTTVLESSPLTAGRFEVAFPFATDKEREAEKAHIEKTYRVITDTDVKGIWITSDAASQLAKEYHLEPYVNALKAASPGKPADSLTPVKGNVVEENAPLSVKGSSSVQSTPILAPEVPSAAIRRSRRSASPKKQPAARAPKAPSSKAASTSGRGRKKKGSVVDDESVASTSPAVPHVVPEELLVKVEGAVEKADAEEGKPILAPIKVDVCSYSPSLFTVRGAQDV